MKKLLTKLLLTIALSASLFLSIPVFSPASAEAKTSSVAGNPDNYTYERVFTENAWWIYVYDKDGIFVHRYLDDEGE